MRWTDAVESGDWLRDRMGGWATVAGVAGDGFAAYARVLHPVGARRSDLAVRDECGMHPVVEEATWPWREVAARTGSAMHPLVQWSRITDEERALDMADGWHVDQSSVGWLDPRVLSTLTVHLGAQTTAADDLVAGFWGGWGIWQPFTAMVSIGDDPADAATLLRAAETERDAAYAPEYLRRKRVGPFLRMPGRDYLLAETSLVELADPDWGFAAGIGWHARMREPSTQLLWPEDRAWVVATEIDWDSTIVAGSTALVDSVLADARIEAFRVRADDDLSLAGDHLNG